MGTAKSMRPAIWALEAITEGVGRLLPERGSPQRLVFLGVTGAFLMLVVPFFFWFFIWYGGALDRTQVEEALADPVRATRAQQMLLLMGEKMSRGDRSLRSFYPRVIRLASHQDDGLRRTVAWLMGKDSEYTEFKPVLFQLLKDPAPLVRRAAAVSLAGLRENSARAELNAMKAPFLVTASAGGRLQYRIQPGDTARPSTVVARITDVDVIAGVPGTVTRLLLADGAEVAKGQALLEVGPDAQQEMEAQRALRFLDKQ